MAEPWESYEWVDRTLDAYCITVVTGSVTGEVVEAFAADPATRRPASFAEQHDMSVPYPQGFGTDTVAIDAIGAAVVWIENNGWAGIDTARAQALSRAGGHVAVYRSVNADMRLVVARGGTIDREFDPLLYEDAGALPEEADLPFGHPGSPSAAAFALVERLTSVRLTREWVVDERHPAYRRDPDR